MESLRKSTELSLKSLSNEEIASLVKEQLISLKKVRRDNHRIMSELGQRSIENIIHSKETCYMGACVDTTLAFLMQLKEKIPNQYLSIWCELLKQNGTWNLTFHLFLVDASVNPQRIIDFVGNNVVQIYEGFYHNPQEGKKITHLTTFYLNAEQISMQDNFLSIASKMEIPFTQENFEGYLKKISTDNTPENFDHFQESSPIQIEIPKSKKNHIQNQIFETLQDKLD